MECSASRCLYRRGEACNGESRQGTARPVMARNKAWRGAARRDQVSRGWSWPEQGKDRGRDRRGLAGLGRAWQGRTWLEQGMARNMARRGGIWRDEARRGRAWTGTARQGVSKAGSRHGMPRRDKARRGRRWLGVAWIAAWSGRQWYGQVRLAPGWDHGEDWIGMAGDG